MWNDMREHSLILPEIRIDHDPECPAQHKAHRQILVY